MEFKFYADVFSIFPQCFFYKTYLIDNKLDMGKLKKEVFPEGLVYFFLLAYTRFSPPFFGFAFLYSL